MRIEFLQKIKLVVETLDQDLATNIDRGRIELKMRTSLKTKRYYIIERLMFFEVF